MHRDLYHGNVVRTGRLSGVIDFGLAVGDPAGDVMAAFHLLAVDDHGRFRAVSASTTLPGTEPGAGCSCKGLEALPYYLDTHPGMVTMARRAIAAALR